MVRPTVLRGANGRKNRGLGRFGFGLIEHVPPSCLLCNPTTVASGPEQEAEIGLCALHTGLLVERHGRCGFYQRGLGPLGSLDRLSRTLGRCGDLAGGFFVVRMQSS